MTITVLIPTYCRPKDLARCLEALRQQTSRADEVLVVVRDTDLETRRFLAEYNFNLLSLRTVTVNIPGMVAALNVGLDAARGDIIAFTDDDAAPHSDWLARIETHFLKDDRVAGVGGRDWLHLGTKLQDATNHPGAYQGVGRVQWWGRVIGNHHIGEGEPREVEALKGVNMSYRRSAIKNMRFDERLRGTGAQVYCDLAFSLALKQAGWKLIYDPMVAVDHYLGERFDEDQRTKSFNDIAFMNMAHNGTLTLLEYLSPVRRCVFLVWTMLVGTRSNLGFVQWLRLLPSEGQLAGQKWLASMKGQWQGWCTWQQGVRKAATKEPLVVNFPSTPFQSRDLK